MPAIDYIETLVDYVLDIKPYHTKIFGVGVEYRVSDIINVSLEEALQINYGLGYEGGLPGENMLDLVQVTILDPLVIDGELVSVLGVGSTTDIATAATICECVLILDGVGFDDEPEGYDTWDFDNVQAVRRFGHDCVDGFWDYNSWDGTTLYYINEQPVASTTWVVVHNLNINSLDISHLINTFDDSNIEIFYTGIVINDPSTFTLTFDTPQSGEVRFYYGHLWDEAALHPTFGRVVLGPQDLPTTNPDSFISYTHVQAIASNMWTINHNTNNYPLEIRSFDVGMVPMLDGTVFHVNRETSIVTFPSPRTGEAWVLGTVETEQAPGPEKC